MIEFLHGIYHDLLSRVERMKESLENGNFDEELRPSYLTKTVELLEDLSIEILEVIESGDLELDFIINNNLIRYNRFNQNFQAIELFRYRVIEKYGRAERYFNKKIERIYDEIENLQLPPIITTISNSEEYYWAHPLYEIIAVPSGEEKNLLNLPDLYHEIGHLIYKQYSISLIGRVIDFVTNHFAHQRQLAIDQNKSGRLIDLLKEIEGNWKNGWIEEFTCDIIGTYLVGPAYAWTNLKLTANSTYYNTVYSPSVSHPSDDSRNRAILRTLNLLGYNYDEIKELELSWNDFQSHISDELPEYYDYYFPDELIKNIVENVVQGCEDIALRSHLDQKANLDKPISEILNSAWLIARKKPAEFSAWERQTISEIDDAINI